MSEKSNSPTKGQTAARERVKRSNVKEDRDEMIVYPRIALAIPLGHGWVMG